MRRPSQFFPQLEFAHYLPLCSSHANPTYHQTFCLEDFHDSTWCPSFHLCPSNHSSHTRQSGLLKHKLYHTSKPQHIKNKTKQNKLYHSVPLSPSVSFIAFRIRSKSLLLLLSSSFSACVTTSFCSNTCLCFSSFLSPTCFAQEAFTDYISVFLAHWLPVLTDRVPL
jgi:hypothetical protein